jgi:excisionase family DNA binding protein
MMKDAKRERVYLTPVEVAELLMVSTASVRLWASKGVLPAQTTAGGHRRFLMSDIKAFAKERGIAIEEPTNTDSKVLIVDDDNQLVRYLSELLDGLPGIEAVETAIDGFDAGQKVERFKPDVVLLDIMMPGMNGFDVCTRLKERKETQDIRVIAMSGYTSQNNVDRMLTSGAEVCLAKPLDKTAVFEALGINA